MKKPTPKQIDALVREIERHTAAQKPTEKQQKAAKLATELRTQLLGLALQFGVVPNSAPASKRLQGEAYQVTATSGTVTSQHPEAVLELRDAMREGKQEAVFATMFTPVTRYDRAKDAANNLANAVLPKKLRERFEAIFARTQSEKPRAATLRIDPIQ